MNKEQAIEILSKNQATLAALNHAVSILYIDGETIAPPGSAQKRAVTLGELSRMAYDLVTDREAVAALEYLYGVREELDPVTRRNVSELWRDLDDTRKIPKEEAAEYSMLLAEASAVWHEAKAKSDYALFAPWLEKVFDGAKRRAAYLDPTRDPYDVTMDQFERGLTSEKCDAFFAELRGRIAPLIAKVGDAEQVDDSPILALYSIEEQRKISDFAMDFLGLDRRYCVLGETEHPFMSNVDKHDVRIHTHYYAENFLWSLYSVVHEGGHALYELHVGDELTGTSLAGGCSMSIHESQSRFFENYIGRSREFTDRFYDFLLDAYPSRIGIVSKDEFYRMVNKAEPSLIRTEADELTYSMHVMIRYDLERRIFDGSLSVADLPREWNRLYGEYLGIDVPDDRRGVLQDSHWSNANIGYFPSYALGSAYGAQYLAEMKKEFDPFAAAASGDLSPVRNWLEKKIWRHGRMMDPTDLFRSVCGEFRPSVYADYLEEKFTALYNL
ncbi:MAG: carboxypeptidase M32 [Clostridia bacterium]|nr:carboxypeptidase M32 [Clostridia bacterium]MBQ4350031.1 carboxypeptidase M32 [Clostridia bacterium]